MQNIACIASSEDQSGLAIDDHAKQALLQKMQCENQQPKLPISLQDEYNQAEQAIHAARQALKRCYGILFKLCHQYYPDQLDAFTPKLMDIASWVGLDMDGRSDISWQQSFGLRLQANVSFFKLIAQDLESLASWPEAAEISSQIASMALMLKQAADEKAKQVEQL